MLASPRLHRAIRNKMQAQQLTELTGGGSRS
jgi:hypothetical protein